jgi:hypothetical protein
MIDSEALRHCEDFLVDSPGGRVGFVCGSAVRRRRRILSS